jgi:hypothetical protein
VWSYGFVIARTKDGRPLKAITALEAFVQDKVFALLETKLDPLLVEWLRDKMALLAS